MRLPIRSCSSRDLQLFDAQGSVPERTDQFGLWTAKRDHVPPRAGCDRHNQAPVTGSAAAAMIPDYYRKKSRTGEPNAENGECEEQVMHKHNRRRPISR